MRVASAPGCRSRSLSGCMDGYNRSPSRGCHCRSRHHAAVGSARRSCSLGSIGSARRWDLAVATSRWQGRLRIAPTLSCCSEERRQRVETPCRRATTTETWPPSASTSANSAALCSGLHCRRRSTTTSPSTPTTPSGLSRRTKLRSAQSSRPHLAGRFRPDAYPSLKAAAIYNEPGEGGQRKNGGSTPCNCSHQE
jgi:hypothetical protein